MVLTDTTTSPVWPNAAQSDVVGSSSDGPDVDGGGEVGVPEVESFNADGGGEVGVPEVESSNADGTQVEESSHTFAATSGLELSRQANHAWLVRRSEQQTVWSYFVVSSSASSSSPILLPS